MPLIKAYNQGRDMRWRAWSDATREGACFALSVQFIICYANGRDFFKWLQPPPTALPEGVTVPAPDAANPFFQNLAQELVAQNDVANTVIPRMAEQRRRVDEAGLAAVAAKYGYAVELVTAHTKLRTNREGAMAFEALPKNRRTPTTTGWAEALAREEGMKYISIATLTGEGSTGHGIAGWVKGGRFVIFDPNFGMFGATDASGYAADLKDVFETRYEGTHGWTITDVKFATFI